jgi:hypothetical protein
VANAADGGACESRAERVTCGLHLASVAPSREHVDASGRAGTQAGFATDGAPGPGGANVEVVDHGR